MNTSFSFSAMIRSGWHIFKKHWKFIIAAGVLTLVINIILRVLQNGAQHQGALAVIVVGLFAALVGLIIALGWSKVGLGLVRKDSADWNNFKTEPKMWLLYIKVTLWYLGYVIVFAVGLALPFIILALIGLGTNIGWLLGLGVWLAVVVFVLVSIFFGIRYQFINFATLDHPHLSGRDVFRKAGAITKGSWLELFAFNIVLGLVNLLGLLCLVIGLAVTIPVTKLAKTKVYEYLKEKHENQHHAHTAHTDTGSAA